MIDGVPQKDTLAKGKWKYYYMKSTSEKDVYAVLVPSIGNPNLYIKIDPDDDTSLASLERPTLTNYDAISQDSIGADTALISGEALKDCSESCVFVIGVYA